MTLDLSTVKLGKLPYKHDRRTLQLDDYLAIRPALPTPPETFDYATAVKTWPMFDNDKLGNCTAAAVGHAIMSWTAAAGALWTPDVAAVDSFYSLVSGYDPTTGANDNGANELDVLKKWSKHGFVDGPRTDKAGAYVLVNARNDAQCRLSAWIFGGLYIGIALPKALQSQGVHWSMDGFDVRDPNWAPGSWGGHAINITGFNPGGYNIITWGQAGTMTADLMHSFVDEVWVIISPDFLNGKKVTPEGFSMQTLIADLSIVSRMR